MLERSEPFEPVAPRGPVAVDTLDELPGDRAVPLAQPRVVVALALILSGIVWAIARGLEFYGLAPAHVAYDLDQPPLLLVLVGAWLLYRSRRR